MKKLTLLFINFILLCGLAFSQSAEIQNVRKSEFKGVYPIINSNTNEAQGYYTFYVNEKIGKGQVNFVVAIFDLEMNLIKQTPITMSKTSNVDGSEFNGEEFLFVFNDWKQKTLTYVTVDKSGNIIKTKGIKEAKFYAATADVYSAGDGFYIVKPIKEKKWGFSIEKVDRELKSLWEKRFMVEKGMVRVEAVVSGEDRIILVQTLSPSLMSKKVVPQIVCLSDKSGEELYTYPLFDSKITCMPTAILIDKEMNLVAGGMYFDGERWDAVNSDGVFLMKLNAEGKKVYVNATDWDMGISKHIKDATKKTFSISSKPKVLFHEIIENEKGEYQIIGETFKKSMQFISSSLKDVITGRYIGYISNDKNNSPVTLEVLDFIVFNFANNGDLANVSVIEKEHTKVSCYRPYNGIGGLAIAIAVKNHGFFNYGFMTKLDGNEKPILIFSIFSDKEPYVGIKTIDWNEESVTHKIPVVKKSVKNGNIGVMKSKPGWLGIYLYNKKDETINMYLEEIKM